MYRMTRKPPDTGTAALLGDDVEVRRAEGGVVCSGHIDSAHQLDHVCRSEDGVSTNIHQADHHLVVGGVEEASRTRRQAAVKPVTVACQSRRRTPAEPSDLWWRHQ